MEDREAKHLRNFGFTVGGVFFLFGVWPTVVRQIQPRFWAIALAGLLLFPAFMRPSLLKPLYIAWTALAEGLAWINTKILLSAVFFVLITPLGVFRRWFGYDSLNRELDPQATTYRVTRPARPASHLTRQF